MIFREPRSIEKFERRVDIGTCLKPAVASLDRNPVIGPEDLCQDFDHCEITMTSVPLQKPFKTLFCCLSDSSHLVFFFIIALLAMVSCWHSGVKAPGLMLRPKSSGWQDWLSFSHHSRLRTAYHFAARAWRDGDWWWWLIGLIAHIVLITSLLLSNLKTQITFDVTSIVGLLSSAFCRTTKHPMQCYTLVIR